MKTTINRVILSILIAIIADYLILASLASFVDNNWHFDLFNWHGVAKLFYFGVIPNSALGIYYFFEELNKDKRK
jgi:hypothetical protein